MRALLSAVELRCAGCSVRWLLSLWSACCSVRWSRAARAAQCGGFSRCGARAAFAASIGASVVAAPELKSTDSVVVAHGLSCSGLWGLPRPEMEPMSLALAGGFFTSEPPGKPSHSGVLQADCKVHQQTCGKHPDIFTKKKKKTFSVVEAYLRSEE